MNINEAIEYMKKEPCINAVNEVGCNTYWAVITGNGKTILWGCPGEYPCCHYDETLEEFIKNHENNAFEITY